MGTANTVSEFYGSVLFVQVTPVYRYIIMHADLPKSEKTVPYLTFSPRDQSQTSRIKKAREVKASMALPLRQG